MVSALAALVLLSAPPAGAQAGPGPFDGDWTARISCPSNTEDSGAKGYSYDFPVRVDNGLLSGAHGAEDEAGSLRIEGRIAPDGQAELRARGRTGNPDYAARKPATGSPYGYRIQARFDGNAGTGTRMETRVCHFTFKRK